MCRAPPVEPDLSLALLRAGRGGGGVGGGGGGSITLQQDNAN